MTRRSSSFEQNYDGAERENQERDSLFASVSDLSFDTILLLDEDLSVIMANGRAQSLFGENAPVGKNLTDLVASSELLNLAQVAMSENESLEEQFVIQGTNYRARAQVIEHRQTRRYIGVGLQDITELVSAESRSAGSGRQYFA